MSRDFSRDGSLSNGDFGGQSPTARIRIPTEKGLLYSKELAEKELSKTLCIWRKKLENAKNVLKDNGSLTVLQEARATLEVCMNDLASVYDKLRNLIIDVDEARELSGRYELWLEQYNEHFTALNQRIDELCLVHEKRGETISTRSSRTSRSSSSSRKAKILSKDARIKAELDFLQIEKDKEVELKRIQMMKELAANKAEIEALEQLEQQEIKDEFPRVSTFSELPNQVEAPYERVRSYVKEQSDSLHQSLSSPRVSELIPEQSKVSVTGSRSVIPPVSTISNVPVSTSLHSTVLPRRPYQPQVFSSNPTFNVVQALVYPDSTPLDATPFQNVRHPYSSNPLYTSPFTLRNPLISGIHPRISVPSMSTYPNNPIMRQDIPNISEDDAMQQPSASNQNNEPLARLADLLTERRGKDKLPLPEPEIFRGDLLHFPRWIQSFETIIESQTQETVDRLFYLGKYTAGEPKEAITGYINQNSTEAYEKAKTLLWRRYGNPFLVADAYKKKIYEWPKILPNDSSGLRKFSDFLNQTFSAMRSTTFLNVLNDPTENRRMVKKLPIFMIGKWSRQVDKRIFENDLNIANSSSNSDMRMQSLGYSSFSEFCKFVEKEARIACNPVISVQAFKSEEVKPGRSDTQKPKVPPIRSLKTDADEVDRSKGPVEATCIYCKEQNNHDLSEYKKFTELPMADRRAFIITKRLCWGCLKWGHINSTCRRKRTCKECKGPHPTSMHGIQKKPLPKTKEEKNDSKEKQQGQASNGQENSVSHCIDVDSRSDTSISHSLIVPVWIKHESKPDKEILVYALLDEQSDACFVKTTVAESLGLAGTHITLRLSTILGVENVKCQKVSGLIIRGLNDELKITLPKAYTRSAIPAQRSQIPDPDSAKLWPHLHVIANDLMPPRQDIEIGLLIGANCPRAIKPREIIPGKDDDPYAIRTTLGWGIIGNISVANETEDMAVGVNKVVSQVIENGKVTRHCCFAFRVSRMFEQDFSETDDGKPLLYEDRKFLEIVSHGIHRRPDNHFEIPLPLKDPNLKLQNNRVQALNRLNKLKRRMESDPNYRRDYAEFMEEIIRSGYAEKVIEDDSEVSDEKDGRIWYLSHHGVYHARKPGKIRVVFDCSAEYKGQSLNHFLLSGPDLTNSLLGVLCRFRQEPIAVTCDIEKMFYQVYVNKEHRNLLGKIVI